MATRRFFVRETDNPSWQLIGDESDVQHAKFNALAFAAAEFDAVAEGLVKQGEVEFACFELTDEEVEAIPEGD